MISSLLAKFDTLVFVDKDFVYGSLFPAPSFCLQHILSRHRRCRWISDGDRLLDFSYQYHSSGDFRARHISSHCFCLSNVWFKAIVFKTLVRYGL